MMKTKGYNEHAAKELADRFVEITGIDLNDSSRHEEKAYFRALLYVIFKDINGMNDRMISEWFADMGIVKNRSSIFHALKKTDVYYNNFVKFRNVYDLFFDDKRKHREIIDAKKSERIRIINERIEKNKAFGERNELHDLIDTIPEDKRKEMYEMINLRIKSWEWKNKDKCEIIESSTSMDGMHW